MLLQLVEQDKNELRRQLDAAVTSLRQADADHRADLEDMQHRIDDVKSRSLAQQHADRQRIDELMLENERLSEQLLAVSTSSPVSPAVSPVLLDVSHVLLSVSCYYHLLFHLCHLTYHLYHLLSHLYYLTCHLCHFLIAVIITCCVTCIT